MDAAAAAARIVQSAFRAHLAWAERRRRRAGARMVSGLESGLSLSPARAREVSRISRRTNRFLVVGGGKSVWFGDAEHAAEDGTFRFQGRMGQSLWAEAYAWGVGPPERPTKLWILTAPTSQDGRLLGWTRAPPVARTPGAELRALAAAVVLQAAARRWAAVRAVRQARRAAHTAARHREVTGRLGSVRFGSVRFGSLFI